MLSYGRWHNESPLCYINNILSIQATRNSHFKKLPKKIFFFFSHSIREKRHKIYLKVFHLRVYGQREKRFVQISLYGLINWTRHVVWNSDQ